MKAYIYKMYSGADPGFGWNMTDPIFGRVPTLGACMPNVRRAVVPGDHIFVISGKVAGVPQYVVGGFQVAEKIDALVALHRFPENRLRQLPDSEVSGNIIVNGKGQHHHLDEHADFESRVEDYIIGRSPIVISGNAIPQARRETLPQLRQILRSSGRDLTEVVGRWRRLDEEQIDQMVLWLRSLKRRPGE